MRLDRNIRDNFLQREMRTYGRKNGYVTKGQHERLVRWLPEIGLPKESKLTADSYATPAPIVMEIGFGNGGFLTHLAGRHPEWNFLGVEIYLPGVAKAVARLEDAGVMQRVRISQLPAQYVLQSQVAEESLHGAYINHPDPWPKARHAKRRLIQKAFASLLANRLEPGGFVKLATDKPDLAEWMREVLDAEPMLRNMAGSKGFIPRDPDRTVTKFEKRGATEGRTSQFLHYVKGKT